MTAAVSGAPDRGLMPIARLSRLTVRALRLYGEEGLLVPAWIDPDSGYRYYRAEQVRRATTISLLRSLGVGLDTVRAVLEAQGSAELAAVLEAEGERAQRELETRRRALRSIERLARSPGALAYDIGIQQRPARRLVGVMGEVAAERLGPDISAACERVAPLLAQAGFALSGGLEALYPLDLEAHFEVVVGVAAPRTAALPAGAVERALRAGRWASTLHVGPYDELPLGYSALLEHVRERGHEPREPIVETYLSDPRSTPPHELVTRIAVGLADHG